MAQLLDDEKAFYETALVKTGNRLDLFKEYYESQATSDKRNAFDTFKQFLVEQGITNENVLDMWRAYLISLGYSGTVQDMEKQFYN